MLKRVVIIITDFLVCAAVDLLLQFFDFDLKGVIVVPKDSLSFFLVLFYLLFYVLQFLLKCRNFLPKPDDPCRLVENANRLAIVLSWRIVNLSRLQVRKVSLQAVTLNLGFIEMSLHGPEHILKILKAIQQKIFRIAQISGQI
ncbi:MAG: hypothetical protein NXI27_22625 [Alphaproteobacteria bacterium]|nr:hypothetical protein [Alphaproteobacteria bacterium]